MGIYIDGCTHCLERCAWGRETAPGPFDGDDRLGRSGLAPAAYADETAPPAIPAVPSVPTVVNAAAVVEAALATVPVSVPAPAATPRTGGNAGCHADCARCARVKGARAGRRTAPAAKPANGPDAAAATKAEPGATA